MRAQDDLVAILEESPCLTRGQCERLKATFADFPQAPVAFPGRTGNRAGAKQVSRIEIATARSMVRHHLCRGPVKVVGVAEREAVWRKLFCAQAFGEHQGFEFDIERTLPLVGVIPEIGQGFRVTVAKAAALSVTADDKAKTYGAADPSLTYTVGGTLHYTDTASVV